MLLTEKDIIKYATEEELQFLINEGFLKNAAAGAAGLAMLTSSLFGFSAYDKHGSKIDKLTPNTANDVNTIQLDYSEIKNNPELNKLINQYKNSFNNQNVVNHKGNNILVAKANWNKFKNDNVDFNDADELEDVKQEYKMKTSIFKKILNKLLNSNVSKNNVSKNNVERKVSSTDW